MIIASLIIFISFFIVNYICEVVPANKVTVPLGILANLILTFAALTLYPDPTVVVVFALTGLIGARFMTIEPL